MGTGPAFHPGDPVPWFAAVTNDNPIYQFASVAGRYVVLCFLGTSTHPASRMALAALERNGRLFDGEKAAFFGISADESDRAENRLRDRLPGMRFFWDFDTRLTRQFGAVDDGYWLVLDPALRVLARFSLERSDAAMGYVASLPAVDQYAGVAIPAPVLIVPRVFEPELCRYLIATFQADGGEASGITKERDGKTVVLLDDSFKKRTDVVLTDNAVLDTVRARIRRRLVPEIAKAFQFGATRIERYVVCCYEAGGGGFFRPHRDNTTKGTAHRRFAVTINLNAEEYEGGDLRFPEFGSRAYRAPTGGAIVFSCSLLHEVLPVKSGRRYAFLPFLYDDAAAKIREENNPHLDKSVSGYRNVVQD